VSQEQFLKSLDAYQEGTRRTATQVGDGLAVLALGIAGEAGEVADSIKKVLGQGHTLDKERIAFELGDTLWYIARMADVRNIRLSRVFTSSSTVNVYGVPEGRFASLALKLTKQAGLIAGQVDEGQLQRINLGTVLQLVITLGASCGYSLTQIAEMNQAKLLKRYPQGFEVARSVERVG
jgi:NTP pyrophosphatase (non-canonical NTP hydrolase)